jgi:hypothetical protein
LSDGSLSVNVDLGKDGMRIFGCEMLNSRSDCGNVSMKNFSGQAYFGYMVDTT